MGERPQYSAKSSAHEIRTQIPARATILSLASDKQNMDISAIALQGLEGAQSRFDQAASKLSAATSPGSATGDVTDLSQATVGLLTAKNDFEGNLKVLEVGDEMERATINMLA